jgi:acyl-CoA thioesterase I
MGLMIGGGCVVAEANEPKKRIVVLGDSITAGYGLDPSQAYPALLQKKIDEAGLPYTIANAGVSGDTTAGGLRRVNWALGQLGADVLLIALGGNDGLRGIPPAQTEQNLRGIVDAARAKNSGMKIVILGMRMPESMGAEFSRTFARVFPKVADEKKAEFIPFLLEGVGGNAKLNQADRIHPTAAGQKVIAEHVWRELRGLL